MINGFLDLPWFLWAAITLIVSTIWMYVWPRKAVTTTTGFRYLVIRWGHAVTWFLLAINFLLRGLDPALNGTADLIAAAGGLVYLLFLAMTFLVK